MSENTACPHHPIAETPFLLTCSYFCRQSGERDILGIGKARESSYSSPKYHPAIEAGRNNDYDKDVFNRDVGIVKRVDPIEQQVFSGSSRSTKWNSEFGSAPRMSGIRPQRMRCALVMIWLSAACLNTSVRRTVDTTPLSIKS